MSVAKVRARKSGFGIVTAEVMQNNELSSDARFLLALVSTLPPDWKFRIDWLRNVSGWGQHRMRGTLNELIGANHLLRSRLNSGNGQIEWEYEFLLEPEDDPGPFG